MGSCPPTTFIRYRPDTLFTKYAIGRSRAIDSHLYLSLIIRTWKSQLTSPHILYLRGVFPDANRRPENPEADPC